MIHPCTELRHISAQKGYGVVALERIPAGTIVWVQDPLDRVFTPEEVAQLPAPCQQILDTYTFRNPDGDFVLCWDHGRYVNHSFRSNCLTTAYDFEICIRNIEAGEEVTDDYGYLNLREPFRPLDERTRRKIVYPDDLVRYHEQWDRKLRKALKAVPGVEQPLRPFLRPGVWEQIEAVNSGRLSMDSILNCYYPGDGGDRLSTTST